MSMALEGIKIIDLSRNAPGPYCTMTLADLGADVIKVEEPGPPTGRRAEQAGEALDEPRTGEPVSPYNVLSRNKRSIGLNLKHQDARKIFYKLAETADVVVEDFRPGVTKRLGVDGEVQQHPRQHRTLQHARWYTAWEQVAGGRRSGYREPTISSGTPSQMSRSASNGASARARSLPSSIVSRRSP